MEQTLVVVTGLATLDPLLLCCIILVLFHCSVAGIQCIMPVMMATNNWWNFYWVIRRTLTRQQIGWDNSCPYNYVYLHVPQLKDLTIHMIIRASRSEPHTNHLYEKSLYLSTVAAVFQDLATSFKKRMLCLTNRIIKLALVRIIFTLAYIWLRDSDWLTSDIRFLNALQNLGNKL